MGADHALGVVQRVCQNVRRAGAEHGIPTLAGKQSAGPPWVKAAASTTSEECSPWGTADPRATSRSWWECSKTY